jgi:hypothetical protein
VEGCSLFSIHSSARYRNFECTLRNRLVKILEHVEHQEETVYVMINILSEKIQDIGKKVGTHINNKEQVITKGSKLSRNISG